MLDSLFRILEALVVQFSWRRFVAAAVLVGALLLLIFAFDWYTGYFTHSRIERSVGILDQLTRLNEQVKASGDPSLSDLHASLISQLAASSQPRGSFNIDLSGPARFFGGGVLWFLFSLVYVSDLRKDSSKVSSLVGVVFFGVVFGLLAQLLPDSWATLGGLAIYSVGNFFGLVALVFLIQNRKK